MTQKYWLEELLVNPRDFIENFFPQGKYYQKIRSWDKSNRKRKNPRMYHIFTLDGEDAKRNATFATYELGIKQHMIQRAYLSKIANLLPMSSLKDAILRLSGVEIEENVFIAPEVVIDPVLRGWIRFRKDSSIGWGVKCFNHLFQADGKIIIGYIDIGEETSIGGFTSIAPGVSIGKKVNIGAEVKICPGVTIGDYAKVGAMAIISPFITIGEGAEVKMGSFVTESVKPYTRVEGNPAKVTSEKLKEKPKLDLIVNPELNKEDQYTTSRLCEEQSDKAN